MGNNRIRTLVQHRVYVSDPLCLNVPLIEKSTSLSINLNSIRLTICTAKFDAGLFVAILGFSRKYSLQIAP